MVMMNEKDPWINNEPFEKDFFNDDTFLDSVESALELGASEAEVPQSDVPDCGWDEGPLPQFHHLTDYLAYARQKQASDLHISAGRSADPDGLHRHHTFRPINLAEVQQLFSVIGDLKEIGRASCRERV